MAMANGELPQGWVAHQSAWTSLVYVRTPSLHTSLHTWWEERGRKKRGLFETGRSFTAIKKGLSPP